jgi:TetR/AcrR family transcriptional repressor of nem operon
LESAASVFVKGGYEGTSIDDLVTALNLHRGSLYKAFGSKRGLFLAVLRHYIQTHLAHLPPAAFARQGTCESGVAAHGPGLDLLLIAAVERGHRDADVAALVRRALVLLEGAHTTSADPSHTEPASPPAQAVHLLGARLYERLHNDLDAPDNAQPPPI